VGDFLIMIHVAKKLSPVLYGGLYAATLSSAIASMVGAPRVLMAFARDGIVNFLRPFAKSWGPNDEPLRAYALTFAIALPLVRCLHAWMPTWRSLSSAQSTWMLHFVCSAVASPILFLTCWTCGLHVVLAQTGAGSRHQLCEPLRHKLLLVLVRPHQLCLLCPNFFQDAWMATIVQVSAHLGARTTLV